MRMPNFGPRTNFGNWWCCSEGPRHRSWCPKLLGAQRAPYPPGGPFRRNFGNSLKKWGYFLPRFLKLGISPLPSHLAMERQVIMIDPGCVHEEEEEEKETGGGIVGLFGCPVCSSCTLGTVQEGCEYYIKRQRQGVENKCDRV